jgi:carbonic anhydrase
MESLAMRTHSTEERDSLSPAEALHILEQGNGRFRGNLRANRDLLQQVNETRNGQWPFAAVLSCIDSRTSAELIFDQGLGDIFSVRIAGNLVNEDILGSLEFACRIAGAKLIVVLGHSGCGAINGACDGVELGHLTGLLTKIRPAVDAVASPSDQVPRTSADPEFVEAVAQENVRRGVATILEQSSVLSEMQEAGAIDVVGGMYCVSTGLVEITTKTS